jgi:cytochrome c oxidase subunit 2
VDRLERYALVSSGLLMAVFLAALVYAATDLKINVPTCVTDVAPFKQGKVIDKGNHHYEVHMVAKMWAFDPPEVRLPPGSDVDLYLSSLDVTHGLYIEHTNVNLMAVPGSVNAARVRFDKEGTYDGICHEYCGTGHHFMMGKFVITSTGQPQAAAETGGVALGQQLFEQKGCAACHSLDGSASIGPTMKGVFGRTVELADGSTKVANESYLEEAIREPGEDVVKDFPPVMPEQTFTAAEVHALVAYLETLK